VAIMGEEHDPEQSTLNHTSFGNITGKQGKFLSVTPPIYRHQRTGRMNGFVLRQNVTVVIKQSHDAGILPEIRNHEL
jgi:hypothetical protein